MDENYSEESPYEELDDGGVEVDLGTEQPQELHMDEDSTNIVLDWGDDERAAPVLREIAQHCKDAFDSAWSSSETYRERIAADLKLFAGEMKPKTFPYHGCANGNIPIFMENVIRILARLETELYGDWTSVVGVVPVGPQDQAIAEAMSKHDNWQMREDIPNFTREAARMLQSYVIIGDTPVHSFYDARRRTNMHECLTHDEFVIPYTHTSTTHDYSDVPYRCKILRRYRHEIQAKEGEWANVEAILKKTPSFDDDPESPTLEAVADVQGLTPPDDYKAYSAPYTLILFQGWCSSDLLPGEQYDRFIQCIFCLDTLHVAQLSIHEEVHWKDRAEHRRRQAELDAYRQAKASSETQRYQQAEKRASAVRNAMQNNATAEEMDAVMNAPEFQLVIPEPVPPAWLADEDMLEVPTPAKSPIHEFSHGVYIEPMKGAFGLGYGRTQADFGAAINTLFNQFVDAASVGNAPPTYTSADLSRTDKEMRPGKITKVDILGEELAKSFYTPPIKGANPQLIEAAQLLMAKSQEAAQAPDVLGGAPGKSGETAQGLMSRIEQATKQLSAMGRKFATGVFKQVLMNNARLNSIFLDEVQMRSILNPLTRQYENLEIRRDMYDRDYKVEVRADLRFTSESQKQQEAMELVQLPQAVPALQGNLAIQYRALKEYFQARKMPEMVQLLGPEPQPPAQFGESLIEQAQAQLQEQMGAQGGGPPQGGEGPA